MGMVAGWLSKEQCGNFEVFPPWKILEQQLTWAIKLKESIPHARGLSSRRANVVVFSNTCPLALRIL